MKPPREKGSHQNTLDIMIFLQALKKYQATLGKASPSNEAVEHSPASGPVLEEKEKIPLKIVFINRVKIQLPEDKLQDLLAIVSGETSRKEEDREEKEKEEKNKEEHEEKKEEAKKKKNREGDEKKKKEEEVRRQGERLRETQDATASTFSPIAETKFERLAKKTQEKKNVMPWSKGK
ncbi:hypothetical protein E5676_scaffold265G001870 [Cucumis melo var. makuwa]|uniref:Protein MNN4-like n=1 Tax=Cucumis melo var. makuwa TaxID=1194695 RepID=A0A5D3C865_CUCMM|nr:hypothetical protein E6C27_scaffold63G001290 [Cucumis melo var. makuwa]TYK08041.1 hypothetical protein E5676_scaffold265G001870 [Cucumis melo var. makuwa]